MRTQKELIRLREREVSGGQKSLYLDIYYNGKRTYEYLRLYLVPEKNKYDREKNNKTRQLAEAVKSKRLVEIQNGIFGFEINKSANIDFLEFYHSILEEKEGNTRALWITVEGHLKNYCKKYTTLADVNQEWAEGFKKYLNNCVVTDENGEDVYLSEGTKGVYFAKVKACINVAFKKKLLRENTLANVDNYKAIEAERVYLTQEEVRKLVNNYSDKDVLQRAFLFSCLTGLRKSEVERLTWGMVSVVKGYTRITFRQKKTKGLQYLDISSQAVKYMGERKRATDKVFAGFKYNSTTNFKLRNWAYGNGIFKEITFHSGRHTFVFLMLSNSVDLYTVSKLVGHKDIATTMKYTHILDDSKRKAVDSIHIEKAGE